MKETTSISALSIPIQARREGSDTRHRSAGAERDNFADFVFDSDYRLPALSEVKDFIRDNGRLPDIPSAKEVKENGMSLVEMQVKLLQKVEKFTL